MSMAEMCWKHKGAAFKNPALNTQLRKNYVRLKFKQQEIRAFRHPVDHCYSLRAITGNITNVPAESLWTHRWITFCQKGNSF